MPEFTVFDLQAADPDGFLALPQGVRLSIHEEKDSMGMSVVDVTADSREKMLDFVRHHWGDDDKDWFRDYVEARIVSDEPVECPVCGEAPFDSWESVLRHAKQWHPERMPTEEMLGTVSPLAALNALLAHGAEELQGEPDGFKLLTQGEHGALIALRDRLASETTERNLEHVTSLPDPRDARSPFGRSLEGSAGTIVLANGRTMQGWVTEVEDDFVYFVYRESGDTPGCGREMTVDAPGDTSRTALVRVGLIAAYEFAGEDGW